MLKKLALFCFLGLPFRAQACEEDKFRYEGRCLRWIGIDGQTKEVELFSGEKSEYIPFASMAQREPLPKEFFEGKIDGFLRIGSAHFTFPLPLRNVVSGVGLMFTHNALAQAFASGGVFYNGNFEMNGITLQTDKKGEQGLVSMISFSGQ